MNTDTVRLNITLPKELAQALNKLSGPRKRSRFISEAIRQRIEQRQKEELDKILEEGYRAMGGESLALAKEFEAVDLEGWDEY
ncbi:CopG family ribbon-helix-helix protein [Thermodesulfobacteriota bacterium]|jgi:metal-responsive CopG/Arc/MetJ family transcriptional regulator